MYPVARRAAQSFTQKMSEKRQKDSASRRKGSKARHSDVVPAEVAVLERFSMSGLRVLKKLYVLGRDVVARNVIGDFVECGVWNGGSAAAIGCALRNTGRHIWLYDSFEGLPAPALVDGAFAVNYAGQCIGREESVRQAISIAQVAEGSFTICKGWFADTFRSPLPEVVSFLHIDADWYDSVKLSLETFYDRVSEGGIIVLDDFGHWEGCREAFYDFIQGRRLKPLLERFGHTQAFWIKGKLHNRDFLGKWEIP